MTNLNDPDHQEIHGLDPNVFVDWGAVSPVC
jgi:hypothetical protein